jgi:hypothetical protein
VDAGLGGGLVKQRIARPGQGKRGGYRTILAYRQNDRAIFLFGFAKNELIALRRLGQYRLGLDEPAIRTAEREGKRTAVSDHDDDGPASTLPPAAGPG